MALPIVTADDQTILLGTNTELGNLISASDSDGDPLSRIQIRNNNNNTDSGYFTFNGVVQPPNTLLTYNWADLALLVYHAGTAISAEQIDIRVEAGGQWSEFTSFLMYSVKENLNRPIVNVSDRTVVQSEMIRIADSVSFQDPDGYPIWRWKVRDRNSGPFSGNLSLNGSLLAPGVWHYVETEDFGDLMFEAAFSAPNNDVIDIRGFDSEDWSFVSTFNTFTTLNFNRPVVVPSEYNMATETSVPITDLFTATDADENTLKLFRFWDATPHFWSGHITIDGFEQAAAKFIEVSAEDLGRVEWFSAQRSFNEQLRVMVFDGNHWSEIETVRIRTNEKPVISVAGDYSIREQLEFVDVPALVSKLDDGPVYTRYEVYDATTANGTGDFRIGNQVLAAGQVHSLNPTEFLDLQFKSGVYEQRSVDELYVRAYNGTFWSDWTRHTVRTEPEYLESLASGSWLNFLAPESNGRLRLTFSFMQSFPSYDSGDAPADEFVRPWDPMRTLVRQAFKRMSEIIRVDFEEVPDSEPGIFGQGGIIRIGTYCVADDPTAAYAFFPGTGPVNGDMWFNRWHTGGPISPPPPDPPCPSAPVPLNAWDLGDANFTIFFHEFGHAMGLKHPFDGSPLLPAATDNMDFSLMSYTGSSNGNQARSPMLYDMAALQEIYGASSFNNGNTVYNRAYFRNNWQVLDTIWDTGGEDTIDASDQLIGSNIDLRPGSFQSIQTFNNIAIAFGVEIENATTGAGNDNVIGNELVNRISTGAGDDTINGYGGNDILMGGAGNDTYIYKMYDGHDYIDEMAGAGRDTIRVGLYLELDNFTEDLAFTRDGLDLVIHFNDNEEIERGSIRINNQAWGKYRVETLEVLGQDVDLRYLYNQVTSAQQQFALTATMGTYGLLVAPA